VIRALSIKPSGDVALVKTGAVGFTTGPCITPGFTFYGRRVRRGPLVVCCLRCGGPLESQSASSTTCTCTVARPW
jgi:hypothetical protein